MKPYPHIKVKIVTDSYQGEEPWEGPRLTTFELTYPRYIHAELMTHRLFSRNAQSSRAIPVKRRLERVEVDPVTPIWWGAEQKGMQAKDEEVQACYACHDTWVEAAQAAARYSKDLIQLGLHKQWTNRLLEPFDTITTIVTASTFDNWFALRCHSAAMPEIQRLAWSMADLYYWYYPDLPEDIETRRTPGLTAPNRPFRIAPHYWHLPYVSLSEEVRTTNKNDLVKMSVARCARVSYLNHDGSAPSVEKDCALHDRLLKDGHMSPFEHQACPNTQVDSSSVGGNFGPHWIQYRKVLPVPDVRTFNYGEALKERGNF